MVAVVQAMYIGLKIWDLLKIPPSGWCGQSYPILITNAWTVFSSCKSGFYYLKKNNKFFYGPRGRKKKGGGGGGQEGGSWKSMSPKPKPSLIVPLLLSSLKCLPASFLASILNFSPLSPFQQSLWVTKLWCTHGNYEMGSCCCYQSVKKGIGE